MKLERIRAIVKSEVLLHLRFRWDFLFRSLFKLRSSFLFFFMYYGFFKAGAPSLGDVTPENYIVFLLLGLVFFTIFSEAFHAPGESFLRKKWWKAVDGLLASPVTTLEILLGIGVAALVDVIPLLVMSLGLAWFLMPVGVGAVAVLLAIGAVMYLTVLGVGLVKAVFVLVNENFDAWFNIVYWLLVAGSCFYYPIVSLPPVLHPFVLVNPLYHANLIGKAVWLDDPVQGSSVVFVLAACVASVAGGTYLFRTVWERAGTEG